MQHLGANVTLLNYIPFGIKIVSKYRVYSVGASYSNKQKMDSSHASHKFPKRNVDFCKFVADFSGKQIQSLLEIGAGRSINANLLNSLLAGPGDRKLKFYLFDRYVNAADYLDDKISAECAMVDVADIDFGPSEKFDLGLTRATLSLLPPSIAKHALLQMAQSCKTIVINECAIETPRKRTMVRSDQHMVHPYQTWLADAGRKPVFHDWAQKEATYNGIITTSF